MFVTPFQCERMARWNSTGWVIVSVHLHFLYIPFSGVAFARASRRWQIYVVRSGIELMERDRGQCFEMKVPAGKAIMCVTMGLFGSSRRWICADAGEFILGVEKHERLARDDNLWFRLKLSTFLIFRLFARVIRGCVESVIYIDFCKFRAIMVFSRWCHFYLIKEISFSVS